MTIGDEKVVAEIGPVWTLVWAGNYPVAAIATLHGLKVGDKLIPHSAYAELAAERDEMKFRAEQLDALVTRINDRADTAESQLAEERGLQQAQPRNYDFAGWDKHPLELFDSERWGDCLHAAIQALNLLNNPAVTQAACMDTGVLHELAHLASGLPICTHTSMPELRAMLASAIDGELQQAKAVGEAELDAKAKAMFDAQKDPLAAPWERQWSETIRYWREKAATPQSSAPVVDDALLADALRWRHIRDECAYSYGDGHTEPVEHGIHLDWMQGAWIRDESNGGIGRPDTFPGWNSLVDNLISNLATELTEDDALDAAMKGVGG